MTGTGRNESEKPENNDSGTINYLSTLPIAGEKREHGISVLIKKQAIISVRQFNNLQWNPC